MTGMAVQNADWRRADEPVREGVGLQHPPHWTYGDILRFWALRQPDAEAYAFLVDGESERVSITYNDLLRQAEQTARRLARVTASGDRVLIMLPSGLSYVVAIFACLLSGRVAVPVHPPRPRRQNDRLIRVIEDCKPRVVLIEGATDETLQELLRSRDLFDAPTVLSIEDSVGDEGVVTSSDGHSELDATAVGVPLNQTGGGTQLAWLQYTSGSTGEPRGVMVTHANVLSNVLALGRASGTHADSRFLSWLPLFHDMGLIAGVMQPMYWGVPSTLMSPAHFLQKPIRWLRAISNERATKSGAPNFAYRLCVKAATTESLVGLDLSRWRVAWNGAEPIDSATLQEFTETFTEFGFQDSSHFLCYGLAEATLYVSSSPYRSGARVLSVSRSQLEQGRVVAATSIEDSRRLVTCGLPNGGLVRIVDPEQFMPCQPGVVGEIWIHGDGVAAGYWGRNQDSVDTFRACLPDEPTRPFLRTGDLGALVDGELMITGRLKDILIVRGRNLYPQDLEAAVARAVPFVAANGCAVVAADVAEGEEVCVVIEADRSFLRTLSIAGAQPETEEVSAAKGKVSSCVRRIVSAVVSEGECAIQRVVFLRPGAFPKTSSGKVQRTACRRGLANGTLDVVHEWQAGGPQKLTSLAGELGVVSELRVTPTAAQITGVVAAYLNAEGLPTDTLDPDASFAELGIDSLGALRVLQAIEDRVGCHLTPQALYDCPTIQLLAAYIDSPAVARRPSGALRRELGSAEVPLRRPPNRTPSQDDLHARYAHRNAKFNRLRADGHYFYGIPLSEQGGAWGTQNGRSMLMLGSYSYLGLIGHPYIAAATARTVSTMGTGHHGVRVLAGTTCQHRELEERLASLLGGDDAIVMSSGFATNVATITALVGEGDYVIGDAWNHASIADGCRYSGADFQMFGHNDMQELELRLQHANGRHTLVVVDAVFSMDGDIVNLPRVVQLCREYGALLMVDEAHSFGVLGARGRGVQEYFGLPSGAIDVKMATLSKAIPSAGGVVVGRQSLIDYLRHHARGYVFSGSLPTPCVSAAMAALDVIEAEPERITRLWQNVEHYTTGLRTAGFKIGPTKTPVVPILCPDERSTMEMTRLCRDRGLFVVPVIYPAVPMNAPRLRTCVLASHDERDLALALDVLVGAGEAVGLL